MSSLGLGLGSLIELASASMILWLYTGSRGGSDAAGHRAQQLIAICFAALVLYVAFDAIDTFAGGTHPDTSWPGARWRCGTVVAVEKVDICEKGLGMRSASRSQIMAGAVRCDLR